MNPSSAERPPVPLKPPRPVKPAVPEQLVGKRQSVAVSQTSYDSEIASLFSQVESEPAVSKVFPKPALRSLPKPVIPHRAKTPVRRSLE